MEFGLVVALKDQEENERTAGLGRKPTPPPLNIPRAPDLDGTLALVEEYVRVDRTAPVQRQAAFLLRRPAATSRMTSSRRYAESPRSPAFAFAKSWSHAGIFTTAGFMGTVLCFM